MFSPVQRRQDNVELRIMTHTHVLRRQFNQKFSSVRHTVMILHQVTITCFSASGIPPPLGLSLRSDETKYMAQDWLKGLAATFSTKAY